MLFSNLFLKDIKLFFPEIFLSLTILILLLYGVFLTTSRKYNYPLVTKNVYLYLLLVVSLTFSLVLNNPMEADVFFMKTFVSNDFVKYTKLFVLTSVFFVLIIFYSYLEDYQINNFEYLLLILCSVFSLNLLISSNDFVSLYLAIEMQALCFYILAAFKKKSVYSTESGLKYFILGAFSSGLLLFSFSLIYGVVGTTNLTEIRYFCLDDTFVGSDLVCVGLIFLVAAFLFKVAAFPFHAWSPDVYEGAPTSTTVFFAIVPKLALVAVFLRIFNYSFYKFGDIWSMSLVFSGIFSIILGAFVAFKQDNLKRLLAYSGVGHVGFILLAFSTESFTGIQVSLFYSLVYILTSFLVWGALIGALPKKRLSGNKFSEVLGINLSLGESKKTSTNVGMWSGIYSINPGLALVIGFGFFSLAGIPPLVGFSAKAFVFFSLLNSSNYLVAMVGVLASVVSAGYYISIIKTVYFEKNKSWLYYEPLSKGLSGVLSLSSFLLVFLFFSPTVFVLLTELMSLSN